MVSKQLRLLWPPCRNFSGLIVAWNTVSYFPRYFNLRMPIFELHLVEGWCMTWRFCKKESWHSMLSKTCIKLWRQPNSDQKVCSIDKTSSERKTLPVIQVIEAMTKLFTAGSDLSDCQGWTLLSYKKLTLGFGEQVTCTLWMLRL